MGVYTRFKREPSGFRALIELLEQTPASRRKKMIDVGMAEDPVFTEAALQYVFTFEDLVNLPDGELAELMAAAPVRALGIAIQPLPQETKGRFLRNAKSHVASEVRDYAEMEFKPIEVGSAQLKVVGVARELERKGKIRTKVIPASGFKS